MAKVPVDLNVALGDSYSSTALCVPGARAADNKSVAVEKRFVRNRLSYSVLDVEVQICSFFAPPKLWLYVRDGVTEVSLFHIGN